MFKKGSIRHIIFGILLIMTAALAAALLFLLSAAPVLGSDIEKTAVTNAELLVPPPNLTANCNPVEVAVFKSRFHIRCANDSEGIIFFAVSTADVPFSNHVLTVALEALKSKRCLAISYESDDFSGVKFGCLANDCRAIQIIAIR